MPQVTAYASNGGSSMVFAQLDLGTASPVVPRPSLTFGLKGTLLLHRGVVALDLSQRGSSVHVVELADQLLEGLGGDLGHLFDAVLVAQQMQDLAIEYLPGELAGLREDHAAVLGIRVVAEVRALVDEAAALGIEHDAEGIGVLLECVAHREVAELGRVALPTHRVTAGPVAGRRRADVQRHLDHVAGVEARAPHLGEFPVRAEIAGAPLGIGLEATAREHHAVRKNLDALAFALHAHAVHAVVVVDQRGGARGVPDVDAVLRSPPW